MNTEQILWILVVLVITGVAICCAAISSNKKKKADKGPIGGGTVVHGEKPAEKKTVEPKKPAEPPASRIKTGITSAGMPKDSGGKAPEKKKASIPKGQELDVLLELDQNRDNIWTCAYCSGENEKKAARCVICGQKR